SFVDYGLVEAQQRLPRAQPDRPLQTEGEPHGAHPEPDRHLAGLVLEDLIVPGEPPDLAVERQLGAGVSRAGARMREQFLPPPLVMVEKRLGGARCGDRARAAAGARGAPEE